MLRVSEGRVTQLTMSTWLQNSILNAMHYTPHNKDRMSCLIEYHRIEYDKSRVADGGKSPYTLQRVYYSLSVNHHLRVLLLFGDCTPFML